MTRLIALVMLWGVLLEAQVYSPIVIKAGQVDTSTLPNLVRDIYKESKAVTPAQKAEAIWRFFLTDGRFVKPGAIYHIAGWAFEEPKGEVLDPLKLLNSYGFGLCYHIAPLLEAVFEAGGFEDARVWFLTGHTVAEVFYDGRYHYYDSDMLGYNNTGAGVASVRQIEQDGRIVTEQLRRKDHGEPWYPADVRANAIDDLAGLFTTTKDNWVYPFQRYESGHTMDFVLRPGERMTRYFHPANDRLFYLPFAQQPDGEWTQFPKEIAQYSIRTANGPRSQKDSRLWGTGRLDYNPSEVPKDGIIPVTSPYVIIDSEFSMRVVAESGGSVSVATSIDSGKTWTAAGEVKGPYDALWRVTPAVLTKGANGKRTAVSGVYAYQVRIQTRSAQVRDVHLATDFALNPRTLPQLTPGHNELNVRTSNLQRQVIPVEMSRLDNAVSDASYVVDGSQGYLRNNNPGSKPGSVVFPLPSGALAGFDVGARFLDLRDGLAPDKYTAEVRRVNPWPSGTVRPAASIEWALSPRGPWKTLWTYDPSLKWLDGDRIARTLRWPEVDRQVREAVPAGQQAYVRVTFDGMAVDDIRLAVYRAAEPASPMRVTHVWRENGEERTVTKDGARTYSIDIPSIAKVDNVALIIECPAVKR